MKSEQEWKNYARKKIREFWNDSIPLDQLRIGYCNFRMKVWKGTFSVHAGVPWIHLRPTLSEEELINTFHHELLHFYLYSKKQPYRDHHEEFITECLRLGIELSGAEDAQIAYRRYREKTELSTISMEEKLKGLPLIIAEGYVYNIRFLYEEDAWIVPFLGSVNEHVCQIRHPERKDERYLGVGKTMENAVYLSYEKFLKNRQKVTSI